jgi:hypothetical protein
MRRKCDTCLCRTCLVVCCDRKSCTGKKESCDTYSGFRQLSIFEQEPKPQYKKAPRYPWDHYNISKQRYKELTAAIRSGRYASLVSAAVHTAAPEIEEYILLSVMKNRSYERVEYTERLGRIPCGRTDFYGYRREFYHQFDMELRRRDGKKAK